MKRASVTFPEEINEALEAYLLEQRPTPALTAVVQEAMRGFLAERGFLPAEGSSPLVLTPAQRGSGTKNTSRDHDRVLARRQ